MDGIALPGQAIDEVCDGAVNILLLDDSLQQAVRVFGNFRKATILAGGQGTVSGHWHAPYRRIAN
jgi:hypothetical protein